jgi:hypothetical protein
LIARSHGFIKPHEVVEGLARYRGLGILRKAEITALQTDRHRELVPVNFEGLAGWTHDEIYEQRGDWAHDGIAFAYSRDISFLAVPLAEPRDIRDGDLKIHLRFEETNR